MGTPPPAGLTPPGSWPTARVEESAKTAARENAVMIERSKSFLMIRLLIYSGSLYKRVLQWRDSWMDKSVVKLLVGLRRTGRLKKFDLWL